jgi:hypothetical protein
MCSKSKDILILIFGSVNVTDEETKQFLNQSEPSSYKVKDLLPDMLT